MFHYDNDFRDKNGERYMLPIRIEALLKQLWCRAVIYREPLAGVERQEGKQSYPACRAGDWSAFDPESGFWGGRDCYVWFRHRFTIPSELEGKVLWYSVEAGDSGYWQWANPQMCLYMNGRCIAGMDSNHRDVEFTECAAAKEEYEVYISGYTDTVYYERPVRFRPYLTAVEPETLSLYYDLKVAFETAHELDTDDLCRVDLVAAVNAAFNLLALAEPDSDRFLASVRAASDYISRTVYQAQDGGKRGVVAAVGSTHIDVAWLWRYEQTREKARRSFATAIRLIDKNPEYIFMCSQPQLYAFVKEDDPALFEEVRRCVREGRWEVEGAMWVEADTNLTGGESLVRQLLFGKRFFHEEFGAESKVLWLPDVFGYSAALPQILKKSGVDYFMTTKISWNEFNKLPYDTFYWRGIDGSAVLSHFIPTREKVQEEKDWMTTYNGVLNPSCVMGAWQRYQQKDLNREILCSFGHGDGGGGTSQEMVEYGKRIARGLPGCPKLHFSKVIDFYHRLEKDVAGNAKTPFWDGELYFEYHRGTYTSVAGIKRRNRKNEIRSHDAENLSVLSGVLLGDLEQTYPAAALQRSWKLLLLNQFHDVIPGSSIGPVYRDAYEHHEVIRGITQDACDRALDAIAGNLSAPAPCVAVFNTLSFVRSAPVTFRYDTGRPLCLQRDGKRRNAALQADGSWLFIAEDVPPKGYCTYEIVQADGKEPVFRAETDCLENEFYRLEFDRNSNLSRVYCKKEGRDMMQPGAVAGRLIAFEDNPRCDDAWNIMAYYEEKYTFVDDVQSARISECNAVRTVLCIERRFRSSRITQEYILYRGQPGIVLHCTLDWKEKDILLKLDFPVKVNTNKASFDIQFGNIERPVHKNTLWDFARFEVCAHKWVDLSDNGFGLTLLNDCKYGYDVSKEHIRLSVLRCATYPDPMQDKCFHEFSCMLLPHAGAADLPKISQAAYSFNDPLQARTLAVQGGTLPAQYSLVRVDRDNLVIETIKKAEDSNAVVLRIYECANCGCRGTLTFGFAVQRAAESDLLEQNPVPVPVSGNQVLLDFAPYEIKTLIVG